MYFKGSMDTCHFLMMTFVALLHFCGVCICGKESVDLLYTAILFEYSLSLHSHGDYKE